MNVIRSTAFLVAVAVAAIVATPTMAKSCEDFTLTIDKDGRPKLQANANCNVTAGTEIKIKYTGEALKFHNEKFEQLIPPPPTQGKEEYLKSLPEPFKKIITTAETSNITPWGTLEGGEPLYSSASAAPEGQVYRVNAGRLERQSNGTDAPFWASLRVMDGVIVGVTVLFLVGLLALHRCAQRVAALESDVQGIKNDVQGIGNPPPLSSPPWAEALVTNAAEMAAALGAIDTSLEILSKQNDDAPPPRRNDSAENATQPGQHPSTAKTPQPSPPLRSWEEEWAIIQVDYEDAIFPDSRTREDFLKRYQPVALEAGYSHPLKCANPDPRQAWLWGFPMENGGWLVTLGPLGIRDISKGVVSNYSYIFNIPSNSGKMIQPARLKPDFTLDNRGTFQ